MEVPIPTYQGDHKSMLDAIDVCFISSQPGDRSNRAWRKKESVGVFTFRLIEKVLRKCGGDDDSREIVVGQ